ncbi:MAG TPA: DUF2157 domain-containing protein [Symbiobacteriaceae bacterium]|jgi:uncharacterized membrane protein
MAERSYPRDFTGLLPEESTRWVSQGLISDEQRASILKLYPEPAGAGRDRTVLIFSILGSLLLAAGVILFFAANWPIISAEVKVGSILTAIVGTYATGYYLTYKRDDYPRLGQAIIFLGGLFYGAGIWLIAQIFHLDSHFPNGFLLWGAGILPVAWATASNPLLYLGTVLLTIWTVSEQTGFNTFNYFYPLLLLGGLMPLARRLKAWPAEAAVLAGLFLWFVINVPSRGQTPPEFNMMLVIGRLLLLYGVAVFTGGLAGIGDVRAYLAIGSVGALGGAYMLTFSTPTYMGSPATPLPFVLNGSPYLMIGTAVILAGVVAGGFLAWRRQGEGQQKLLLGALGLLTVAALAANFPTEVVRMISFNLLLFFGTVGLIALGVGRRSAWIVNLGLVIFIIHVLTRYFDFFFSAMSRSGFFMVGGILLLGGGWLLERNRRRWMQQMGGDGNVR